MPYAATFQQNVFSLVAWIFVQDHWNPHPLVDAPGVAMPLIAILGLAACSWLIGVVRKGSARDNESLTWSFASVLGVLFAPRVGDYHYALLLIPIFVCFDRLWSATAGRGDLILFGAALLLLSAKIPYTTDVFQKTWLGVLGFPRVFGAFLILLLLARFTRPFPHDQMIAPPLSGPLSRIMT